jgi:hypothetical protein
MKKAISYSLFGYERDRHKDCFDFQSYLRSMHICIRFNRILYNGWDNVINIDEATYNSPYRKIFDWHQNKGFIRIKLWPNGTPLCKAMLWRLATVFDYTHPEWNYTHVICRDLDSISTYREAQMVKQWIDEDKAMHCITDSVSHVIPMMGGLVGFRPGYINDLLKLNVTPENAWNRLLSFAPDIDYNRKGSDQDFMNKVMYPKLCLHATEHFIKGMPHNLIEGNGRHYSVDESIDIGVSELFKATNLFAGHAGAAGFYEIPTLRFLNRYDPYEKDFIELETMPEFAQVFYWRTREDLK